MSEPRSVLEYSADLTGDSSAARYLRWMTSSVLIVHGLIHSVDLGRLLAIQFGMFVEAGDLISYLTSSERVIHAILIIASVVIVGSAIGILRQRRLAGRVAFWALLPFLANWMYEIFTGLSELADWKGSDRIVSDALLNLLFSYPNLAASSFPLLLLTRPMFRLMQLR